jgi:hypothetical protein
MPLIKLNVVVRVEAWGTQRKEYQVIITCITDTLRSAWRDNHHVPGGYNLRWQSLDLNHTFATDYAVTLSATVQLMQPGRYTGLNPCASDRQSAITLMIRQLVDITTFLEKILL